MARFSPAAAYWNQRHTLARIGDRLQALFQAVNHPTDLSLPQWAQFAAMVLDFAPDLVLELGRGRGNSTCAFTEAANLLGPGRCRVVSLCLSDDWERLTLPRLRQVVPASWLDPLQAIRGDILAFDFAKAVAGAKKILVFWDAHGWAVAECVLGRLLPAIADRPHVVLMHDMSDHRYCTGSNAYGPAGIWKGGSGCDHRYRLGHIDSHVAQAVCILDFVSRNRIPLESGDHSYHTQLVADPARLAEMRAVLGERLFTPEAHWFWFSLNDAPGPLHFPRVNPEVKTYEQLEEANARLLQENASLRHEKEHLQQQLWQLQQSRGSRTRQVLGRWLTHGILLGRRLGFFPKPPQRHRAA
jgi:hypothetical protein